MSLDSMAGETKLRYANGLWIDNLHWITFYSVTCSLESANSLNDRRLEIFRNENIAEIILRVQVVDWDPFDIRDLFVVGKF